MNPLMAQWRQESARVPARIHLWGPPNTHAEYRRRSRCADHLVGLQATVEMDEAPSDFADYTGTSLAQFCQRKAGQVDLATADGMLVYVIVPEGPLAQPGPGQTLASLRGKLSVVAPASQRAAYEDNGLEAAVGRRWISYYHAMPACPCRRGQDARTRNCRLTEAGYRAVEEARMRRYLSLFLYYAVQDALE